MTIKLSFLFCASWLLASTVLSADAPAAIALKQPPTLQLQRLEAEDTYKLTVINEDILWEGELKIRPNEPFCKELEVGFSFCGRLTKNGSEFQGYFQSGILQYPFQLYKDDSGKLVGRWRNLVYQEAPISKGGRPTYSTFVSQAGY